jgi:hypothetical protein
VYQGARHQGTGGQEIIKLQRVDMLWCTRISGRMPVNIGTALKWLDILHGVKKQ